MTGRALISLPVLALTLLFSANAPADIFSFDLSNKAPGAQNPPDYGLRLDDLFTSPTASIWTFSFDQTDGASVRMDVDTTASTVRIFGTVVGGLDVGTVWQADTIASWDLDFLYDTNITVASDGYWSVPMTSSGFNFGSLELLSLSGSGGGYFSSADIGKTLNLADFKGGDFVASGGPSPQTPYVSAWLQTTADFVEDGNTSYVRPTGGCCMDFGFRATPVPEPGSLALLALGLFGISGLTRIRQRG